MMRGRLLWAAILVLCGCNTGPDSDACVPPVGPPPCPSGTTCEEALDVFGITIDGLQPNQPQTSSPFTVRRGGFGIDAASLLRVNVAQLRTQARGRSLTSAVLSLTVSEAAQYVGNCAIALHPIRREWDLMSATWQCAADRNPSNTTNDCSAADTWNENGTQPQSIWDPTRTLGTASPCNASCAQSTGPRVVDFDLTDEVRTALEGGTNYGWALTRDDGQALQVGFVKPARLRLRFVPDVVSSTPPGPLPVGVPTTINDLAAHVPGAGTVDQARLSVIRGRVRGPAGDLLRDVRVHLLRRPGDPAGNVAFTGADGIFDLAVAGGGPVTLVYERSTEVGRVTTPDADYIPVQRDLDVPARDFVWAPDVALRPYATGTVVNFGDGTESVTVVTGPRSDDSTRDGTTWKRTPRLFIPSGVQAELDYGGGFVVRPPRVEISATEFTVNSSVAGGPRGADFMPGTLPPSSAYTYALEFAARAVSSPNSQLPPERAALRFVPSDKPEQNQQPPNGTPAAVFCIESLSSAFRPGATVPIGYYDREQGRWVGSPDGRVLAFTASLDPPTFDLGLSTPEATIAALRALGITEEIAFAMRDSYAPEPPATSNRVLLWCGPITHFTPFDANHAWAAFVSAITPRVPAGTVTPLVDPCRRAGSIIECENQTLGEELGVVGTPFALHYQSDRSRGRTELYKLEFPLWTGTAPAGVDEIAVDIQIAGRRLERTFTRAQFSTAAGRMFSWTWDGYDAFGRLVEGAQPVTVRVGYGYSARYVPTPSDRTPAFGEYSDRATEFSATRDLVFIWQTRRDFLGLLTARSAGLGGWTLSEHHAYDPRASVLYLGSGERRAAQALGRTVSTVAGQAGGDRSEGPVSMRSLGPVHGVAIRRDGAVFFTHRSSRDTVRRLATIGGVPEIRNVFPRQGDAAPDDTFEASGLAFGPDDTLYVADTGGCRVLSFTREQQEQAAAMSPPSTIEPSVRLDLSGVHGCSNSGGADPSWHPHDVAVARDGTLYVSLRSRHLVLRLRPDESTPQIVLGEEGLAGVQGDGNVARPASGVRARVNGPSGLDVLPDGSLLVADSGNCRVRRLGPDGVVTTVAGSTSGSGDPCGGMHAADGRAATSGPLTEPRDVAAAPDGSFYVLDAWHSFGDAVRRVGTDGMLSTVADSSSELTAASSFGDGRLATNARYEFVQGIALDPEGALYIADTNHQRIRRAAMAYPSIPQGHYPIFSEDGGWLYDFDEDGRHLSTQDALTGRVMFSFEYDSAGALSRVIDHRDGGRRTTRVERSAPGGRLVSITAPSGQTTTLEGDSFADLTAFQLPVTPIVGPERWALAYESDGLLRRFEEPTGAEHVFQYDTLGRLLSDRDAAFNAQTLARAVTLQPSAEIERVETVSHATPRGRVTQYQTTHSVDGLVTRAVTPPERSTNNRDLTSITRQLPNGRVQVTSPIGAGSGDNTIITTELAPDPIVGAQASYVRRVQFQLHPARSQVTLDRTRRLGRDCSEEDAPAPGAIPADPTAWTVMSERVSIDGRDSCVQMRRNGDTIEVVSISPMGRRRTTIIDRPTGLERATVSAGPAPPATDPSLSSTATPITLEYQSQQMGSGTDAERAVRIQSVRQQPRQPMGQPTQPPRAARVVSFAWNDAFSGAPDAGWLASVTSPEGYATSFAYDAAGRTTDLTLPGARIARQTYAYARSTPTPLQYTATPPGRGPYRFGYDARGLLASAQPPSVAGAGFANNATRVEYDADGATATLTQADGTTLAMQTDAGGRLQSILGAGFLLAYRYEGEAGQLTALDRVPTSSADGVRVSLDYSNGVPERMRWGSPSGSNGVVQGAVERSFNTLLEPTEIKVYAGASLGQPSARYELANDLDGLLTRVGPLRLDYDHDVDGTDYAEDRGLLRRLRVDGSTVVTDWQYDLDFGMTLREETRAGGQPPPPGACTDTQGPVFRVEYQRDSLGRITQRTECATRVMGGSLVRNASVTRYCYDAAGRLRAAGGATLDCATAPSTFQYGANGVPLLAGTTEASYDGQDRLLSMGSGATLTTFAYTANGERSEQRRGVERTTYAYDLLGNLRRVQPSQGQAIDYLYDALGRRVARRVGGTVTQRLLYLDDLRPAAELDATGTRLTALYLYASRRNVPDYVVTYGTNGSQTGTFRIVTDHLGSPRAVVHTTSGAVVASARYDEWGREVEYGAVMGWRHLPFGYAGGLVDRDPMTGALVTKLVHFGAREYDPETRQWLRRDPSGFNGGLNLYGYVEGDPVNWADVDGNHPVIAAVAGGVVFGAVRELSREISQGHGTLDCVNMGSIAHAAIIEGATALAFSALFGAVAIAAIRPATLYTRALVAADLGFAEGTIVQGTFTIRGTKATAFISYIGRTRDVGLGRGLLGARSSLAAVAREEGATTLRIETTNIIEKTGILARALKSRGFMPRSNGTTWWEGAI